MSQKEVSRDGLRCRSQVGVSSGGLFWRSQGEVSGGGFRGMSLLDVSGGGLWGDFRGKAQVEDSGFKSQAMVSQHGLRGRSQEEDFNVEEVFSPTMNMF